MLKQFISAKIYDKNKNIIGGFDKKPAESFVKNFYNRYCFLLCGVTPSESNDLDLRDTGGTSRATWAIHNDESYCWRGSEAEVSGIGIVVGSGDTAEDFGMGSSPSAVSYALDTIIANGSGNGQLEWAATGLPVISTSGVDPITWSTVWTRYFNNNSGGNVICREIGVYIKVGLYTFMITRDVLVSPLTIYDTGQLKIEYTLEIDIPA